MKYIDATRILLNRPRITNKLRKDCQRARETVMRSETPIYCDEGEYFSSKPSELTQEQRLLKRLGRATLSQLAKWGRRHVDHQNACAGILERCPPDETKRRQLFSDRLQRHKMFKAVIDQEVTRRSTPREK